MYFVKIECQFFDRMFLKCTNRAKMTWLFTSLDNVMMIVGSKSLYTTFICFYHVNG